MKKFINFIIITLLTLFIFLPSSVLAAQPVEPNLPRVIDDDNLLTDEEERQLEVKIKSVGEKYSIDIVIITTNNYDGKSAQAFADDYFDYNKYGYGKKFDGLLLAVNLTEDSRYISTKGKCISRINDKDIQTIGKKVRPLLDNGAYNEAFSTFITLVSSEFSSYYTNALLISGGVCLLISLIFIGCSIYSMNNARKNNSAMDYVGKQGITLTAHNDIFTHSHISKSKKAESSSSGGGGSSTHTSSSGSTHGGGSF